MKGANIPFVIMSLVASVALWMYVYIQNTRPMVPVWYSVHLEPSNLDTKQFVVTRMDDVVRFSASGPENEMQRLKDKDLAAVVDLSRAQPGTRTYPVQVLPQEVQRYINQKELEAKVSIEPLGTRTIPVVVEGYGRLSDPNMRLTDTVVDPTEIALSGPQSQVDRAIRARARLDLSKVDPAVSHAFDIDLDILDRHDRPLDPTLLHTDPIFVRVTPVLTATPEQKTAFVVPQIVGQPAPGYVAAGYDWQPRQVQLGGPSLLLASVSKVVTAPVDITGIQKETSFRTTLVLPKGLTADASQQTVTVRMLVRPTDDKVNKPNP